MHNSLKLWFIIGFLFLLCLFCIVVARRFKNNQNYNKYRIALICITVTAVILIVVCISLIFNIFFLIYPLHQKIF